MARYPWISVTLCAVIVWTTLLVFRAALPQYPNAQQLILYGAKHGPRILEDGEVWRLFTCHFLHSSWAHLWFNILFLLPLAVVLECVVRRSDFVLMMIAVAIGSGLASLVWTVEVSVGSSGLAFGVVAVTLIVGFFRGGVFGWGLHYRIVLAVLPFFMFFLALNVDNTEVDRASHFGGAVAGFFASWIVRLRTTPLLV